MLISIISFILSIPSNSWAVDRNFLEVVIERICQVKHKCLCIEIGLRSALGEVFSDLTGSFDSLELNVSLRLSDDGSDKFCSTGLSLSLNDQ